MERFFSFGFLLSFPPYFLLDFPVASLMVGSLQPFPARASYYVPVRREPLDSLLMQYMMRDDSLRPGWSKKVADIHCTL